ncbi:inorganic phosphate transporter [Paraburkholderia diazotrophica]|uniref:inorganic phosphate transporter n=1 Tax=Paraburkholderia diazotrophica TaxID=667676 RepID=UPI00316D740F
MLAHFAPSSGVLVAMLAVCFVLVLAFETTNGFHDSSNAVATVIYTQSLGPARAVVWSGIMNFIGVLAGGIAVAYALVRILPPEVLTPPDGSPAVPMLIAVFASALFWNVLTWAFGIPNSSSHCLIGALIGVAASDAILASNNLAAGVDWKQIISVLRALAVSPLLGFFVAGALYGVLRLVVPRGDLFEPPKPGQPPVWWLRGLLILSCTLVSFSHGTNDGQKSVGLIMLTIIGLLPATYAVDLHARAELAQLDAHASAAIPLIEKYGDERKDRALQAARQLQRGMTQSLVDTAVFDTGTRSSDREQRVLRSRLRSEIFDVTWQMNRISQNSRATPDERKQAGTLIRQINRPVEYAPYWVRLLSALCLGLGTMVGYRRVVRTLGERLGRQRMTPGQGASAELVGSALISTAGFTGLPVSTTHIVTSGITGTMAAGGQGVQTGVLVRIALTWLITLPVTMIGAGAIFYLLANPKL